jgi:hypothetical protein
MKMEICMPLEEIRNYSLEVRKPYIHGMFYRAIK